MGVTDQKKAVPKLETAFLLILWIISVAIATRHVSDIDVGQ